MSHDESMTATRTIDASTERVFDVLADPATHAAIDGTGWVREPLDSEALTSAGQVFRMAMHHANHPDGDYEMANRVELIERPTVIAWMPGQAGEDGSLGFGNWTWRYDLTPAGPASTEVTLSYDWSAVPAEVREFISFPPFPQEHLTRSLEHLAELAGR